MSLNADQQAAATDAHPMVLCTAGAGNYLLPFLLFWAIFLLAIVPPQKTQEQSDIYDSPRDCGSLCAGTTFEGRVVLIMIEEQWKPIIGYETDYHVSDHGHIRSVKTKDSRGYHHTPKQLSTPVASHGYKKVCLCKEGKVKQFLVSRLVAIHFIHNPTHLPEVNHKDGVKTNDRCDNLEWVTGAQNKEHAKQVGLNHNFCEGHCYASLTDAQAISIRLRYKPYIVTGNMLAKEYGVSRGVIYSITNGTRWRRLA
jgi:hypothetical protein